MLTCHKHSLFFLGGVGRGRSCFLFLFSASLVSVARARVTRSALPTAWTAPLQLRWRHFFLTNLFFPFFFLPPTTHIRFYFLSSSKTRYTGFNGTKIWEAIYRENCFSRVDEVNQMCYEERVLFRMLSGMHSSINIHIALNWHPPRKGKRDSFAPNTARFEKLFKNHPDRLKNMHFAFVVMLRAMQKSGPHLLNYDMATGDSQEDFRTKKLLHRLLDSDILHSCGEVFEAFDETLLFGSNGNGATLLPVDSLKNSFKGRSKYPP